MPTLQFKGKNIIWNHHLSVPYHSLEEIEDLSFEKKDANNKHLIVEGDNLLALKALLPQYSGKVDCIYIDPPYNTGNDNGPGKGWVYNDNTNSPLIREWLGKEVGKDDLTRHDKWLCMMVPRLKLLRELLSEKGVIFISIDNNEYAHLELILTEIFSESNLLGTIIQNKQNSKNDALNIQKNHEYILVLSKNIDVHPDGMALVNWVKKTKEVIKDGDEYYLLKDPITTRGEGGVLEKRENLGYTFYYNPETLEIEPRHDYKIELVGTVNEESELYEDDTELISKGFVPIRPPKVRGKLGCWTWSIDKVKKDIKNLLVTGSYGNYTVKKREFVSPENVYEQDGKFCIDVDSEGNTRSIIDFSTNEGTIELNKIFGEAGVFDNPKNVEMIKYLIQLIPNKNAIVLDSFAGSGTTGQAVMDLNRKDGGNRQFVLVQMTEASEKEPNKNICKDKTRERIKKVIEAYDFKDGFKYLRVGSPIDPETMLDGDLPTYQQFAEYVYYLATGGHLADKSKVDASKYFVGMEGGQAVYLIYEQDMDKLTRLALTLQIAESIVKHSPGKRRVVFAPSCFLDEEYMTAMQIEFVSVPYNLFERKNNG